MSLNKNKKVDEVLFPMEKTMTEKNLRSPKNTSQISPEDIFFFFVEATQLGTPALLNQAAQEQRSLVNSDTLPTEMHGNAKETLEFAGVKFLDVVEGDDLFQYVELPQGWKKVATDDSKESKLVDEQGRKRAAIFYKAAFYDRYADLSARPRYTITIDYKKLKKGVAIANIMDDGNVIHTTKPDEFEKKDRTVAKDTALMIAEQWLDNHYPAWQDATAYWD